MPKIPDAFALGQRPEPQPQLGVATYDATAPARAQAQLGATLMDVGADLQRRVDIETERMDRLRAEEAVNQYQNRAIDLNYGEQGFSRLKGAAAVTQPIAGQYNGKLEQARKEIESTLGNARQREFFASRAMAVEHPFKRQLLTHIGTQGDAYAQTVAASTIDSSVRAIGASWNDEEVFALSMLRADKAIEEQARLSGAPPEAIDTAKQKTRDLAWKSRLDAWRQQDPIGALSALQQNADQISPGARSQIEESLFRDAAPVMATQLLQQELRTVAGTDAEARALANIADSAGLKVSVQVGGAPQNTFDHLPPDQKIRVLDMARIQAGQQVSVDRQRITGLLRDAEAAALDGKTMAIPEASFAVFGDQAGQARQQYQNSQRLARNIASLTTMPVSERIALADGALPEQAAPGYAEAAKRAADLTRAVAETNRRQAADPVAFTLQSAPQTVAPAFQQLQQVLSDPQAPPEARKQAAQAFAAATVAEQQRLEQTPGRGPLRARMDTPILPKPMAESIARQFMTPAEGGQGPAQLIQQQADLWGPYWSQVYRQISKDIGPTARVVANLRDTPAAAMLSMNASVKTPELRKPLASADAKAVDDTIDTELVPFRESLVGWTTQGSATFNDFDEAARRNAYVYAAQGVKPGEAAKRAVREIVNEYYDFRGAVRIPKLPSVDPRAVETGMAAALKDADKLGVQVPEQEARMLGPEFTAGQIAASVKKNGFFVTLGDDSGVALHLQGANGERAVEGKDGKPITFTWKELTDRAIETVIPPRAVQFGESGGGAATGMTKGRRTTNGAADLADLRIAPENVDASKFGARADGTNKGTGFLGILRRPDGGVSTEISVGVNIDGKEMEIPTLVPTLTRQEVETLLKLDLERGEIPRPIIDKAVAFARQRMKAGKSPFAGPDEGPYVGGRR